MLRDPDPDQVARRLVLARQRMQRTRQVLLGNLALERHREQSIVGRGLLPKGPASIDKFPVIICSIPGVHSRIRKIWFPDL